MWWDRARRTLGRIEVRLTLLLALATSLVVAGVLGFLLLRFAHESLDDVAAYADAELRGLGTSVEGGHLAMTDPLLDLVLLDTAREGFAIRLRGADGSVKSVGDWPAGAPIEHRASGLDALQVGPDDYIWRSTPLADGRTLEIARPLRRFSRERSELARRMLAGLVAGVVASALASLLLARRALAPLRSATDALAGIDESHLGQRLPERGTGDLLDRHAALLNRVLSRLEWSFGRMRAFSADVAHELRTPVNRILNVADVAALREDDPESWRAALQSVHDSASEMARLIETLLLLARGEEGRLVLQQETVALADLVDELAEFYAPVCEEKELALEVDAEDVKVSADRGLLVRAVSNLLENAIRETPRLGRLRVAVLSRDGEVEVRVSDSGRGVPEADRERIFERFVQLDAARTGSSAGLGLPLARMIARLHGGDLRAGRSRLGGARFTLSIPFPGSRRRR